MHLTRIWFAASNLLAWICLLVFVGAALASATFGPLHYAMSHVPVNWFDIALGFTVYTLGAVGCFGLTRHKVSALPLVLCPGITIAIMGNTFFGLSTVAFCAVIFGTPFLLVFLEAHNQRQNAAVKHSTKDTHQ